MRIPQVRTGSSDHDSEQEENQVHPHRPVPVDASHDSQRRRLAREINEIIKASAESTGGSTGLNRRS